MNKKTTMSFIAFAATFALSLAIMHVMLLFDMWYWTGVIAGTSMLVVSLAAILIIKKCKPLFFKRHGKPLFSSTITVNAVGDGLAASSLFMYLGYAPTVTQSVVCFAVMCALFAIYCLFVRISAIADHPVIYTLCFVAVTVTALILFAVYIPEYRGAGVLALLFYVIFLGYIISTAIYADDANEHLKTLAYCSFVVLVVVIIVVTVVLSEGGGDGFDLPSSGGKSNSATKRNCYTFEELST